MRSFSFIPVRGKLLAVIWRTVEERCVSLVNVGCLLRERFKVLHAAEHLNGFGCLASIRYCSELGDELVGRVVFVPKALKFWISWKECFEVINGQFCRCRRRGCGCCGLNFGLASGLRASLGG